MSYSSITFKDKNPIKRWLQLQRLRSAIELFEGASSPQTICDFGAGNGELCKILAERYPEAKILCYEPTPSLLAEAKQNLSALDKIEFGQDIQSIPPRTFDLIFCLEVFEHLPPEETFAALQTIHDLLKPGGIIIIGVPIEVGIPALYKGVFRMVRRYGAFDANMKNVVLSFFGRPPRNRPISEITPGFRFHFEHMGFDFRHFKNELSAFFRIDKISSSPFALVGSRLMPEIYFHAKKTNQPL